ncbi:MAG: hypothetical protein GY940_06440 [bacterium]|nr:hypothetical protein [bacterium]
MLKKKNTRYGLVLAALFFLASFTVIHGATDTERADAIKQTLLSIKIDVVETKIVDGRQKGGVRALVVTFKTNEKRDQHAAELIKIFQSGSVLNTRTNADLAVVVAVAGSNDGKTRAIITVEIKDTEQFLVVRDAKEFLRKWKVNLLDRSYLAAFSKPLGWLPTEQGPSQK